MIIILYTYIATTHYKLIIAILSTCKYVISSHAMSSFSIEKYFLKFKEHARSPYAMSSFSIEKKFKKITSCHITFLHWKIIRKIQVACHITSCHVIFLYWKIILNFLETHLMPHHLSLLKNNSKNSRSMSRPISSLENNYKNSRKSPPPTSHLSLKNNSKTLENVL
jgi:hypothetical protein